MMMMWPGMESTRFVLAITIIITLLLTASHKLQANQLVAAPYICIVINVRNVRCQGRTHTDGQCTVEQYYV